MLIYLIEILIFIFGICIGSFMNVCIYRLPASKSIINPARSICPNCGNIIRSYDNIPVLSYLWLKGKCRHCNSPIVFRYLLVELTGGFFALCIYFKFGITIEAFVYYALISSLLVITFIDIDHQIIPDVITLPSIPIFFFASFTLAAITCKDSLLGILAGGGSLLLIAVTYNLLTKKEGMGGGDIKLLAMIGAALGWKGVLFTIFIGSAIGTLVGIVLMLRTRKGLKLAIPFGPFLSMGAIIYIFFGSSIINWYLK
ncbi:MAG: prepilin peptidase [Desulfobacteraceae bacterium]|nr:prepilin peptidase [Desulfobacteraceae bacterium]MBC2720319.1 prepilin peptidase [Desulfobacteraceae bacterium]